jgi:tetratricopeptide (TPR) repeat protein
MNEEMKPTMESIRGGGHGSLSRKRLGLPRECPLHAEEVKRFQQLLKDDPEYAYRRCGLTLLYSLPGGLQLEELKKFGWKARDARDLFNLGAQRAQSGESKEALKYFEKAGDLDPQQWEAFFNIARCQQQAGEKKKAKSAMEKCIKLLDAESDLYHWEKESLEQAKKFLESL